MKDGWKEAITSEHDRIKSDRLSLRIRLLEEDILVLNGEIEDYYPDVEISNKIGAALDFSANDYDIDELRGQFVNLHDREETDMESFLGKIFQK